MYNFAAQMKRILYISLILIMAGLVISSCTSERKKMRRYSLKGTILQKDTAAYYYYENEQYEKANFLFQELMGPKRGTPEYEDLVYKFAWGQFKTRDYITASHYFELYTKQFPSNERAQECAFQNAYCYYMLSAPHYLDQGYTNKAIDLFQYFLVTYPESEKIPDANQIISDLRERLAKKAFEHANLYYKVGSFKAGVTSFQVMLQEFPDSRYQEEGHAMLFKSMVALADVSTTRRQKNRYLDAIEAYEQFVDRYPQSVFIKDVEGLYVKAKKSLGKLQAEETQSE